MHNIYENSIESPKEQMDKRLLDFLRNELLVGIPAVVTSTDKYEVQQVVDVQPLIDDILIDERELVAQVIKSVFVKIPAGGGFAIKLPIAVGDLVTLHYSHKDLSSFLDGLGSKVSQSVSKVAQRRDCWVTHGFGTRNSNQAPSAVDYVTEGPSTTITITPDGKVTLDTSNTITVNTTADANLTASGGCNVTANTTITGTVDIIGNTTITGNLGVSGTITAPNGTFSTSLKIDNKELKDHKHGEVTTGTDQTGTNLP